MAHRSQPDSCPFHSPGRASILERSLGLVWKLSQPQGQHPADGGFWARGASVLQPHQAPVLPPQHKPSHFWDEPAGGWDSRRLHCSGDGGKPLSCPPRLRSHFPAGHMAPASSDLQVVTYLHNEGRFSLWKAPVWFVEGREEGAVELLPAGDGQHSATPPDGQTREFQVSQASCHQNLETKPVRTPQA